MNAGISLTRTINHVVRKLVVLNEGKLVIIMFHALFIRIWGWLTGFLAGLPIIRATMHWRQVVIHSFCCCIFRLPYWYCYRLMELPFTYEMFLYGFGCKVQQYFDLLFGHYWLSVDTHTKLILCTCNYYLKWHCCIDRAIIEKWDKFSAQIT